MLEMLTTNWWAFVLRGLAALALGVFAFVWPGTTLAALILVFAFYAVFDGVLAVMAGLGTSGTQRLWFLIGGVAGIAVGVLTFFYPNATAVALVLLIGAWAIVTGVAEIVAAYTLRRVITREWLLALSGVLSVAFGVLLVASPGSGALALLWLIGFYAILAGITYLAAGLRLRGLAGKMSPA
jgi:uncharacterized membrane protein HdeD (DUF308 family)